MRSPFMIFCVLSTMYLLGVERVIAAQPIRMLSADLAFHFICRETQRVDIENRLESLLRERGFRVLNQARIQRQHDVHIFDTNIVALNQNQGMIEVKSVPGADRRYVFYLYSEPPTKHATSFEGEILSVISEDLKCETRQVTRKENAEERRELYESELRRVQRLFEDAEKIEGGRRI